MRKVSCQFCDKKFTSSAEHESDMPEELRLHVIEHHHITAKRYYAIRDALEMKQSLNEICNEMKTAVKIFDEKIDSVRRDEIVDRLFPPI
jgi:uncharacterized Zn finger protein (UPF0148 family)